MNPELAWKPLNKVEEVVLDLDTELGLERLAPRTQSDERTILTSAGGAFAVATDIWREYDVRIPAIDPDVTPEVWAGLHSFGHHALHGGTFRFTADADRAVDTTLSSAALAGATTLDLPTAAEDAIAAGDYLIVHDAADFRITEVVKVAAVAADVELSWGLLMAHATASVVRHREHLPLCRLNLPSSRSLSFAERDAGRGVNLWDFRMRFRTLR